MPNTERRQALMSIAQEHGFSMILMIDDWQAELDRFGKLRPNGGFCYGYAEYWKLDLLHQDPESLNAQYPDILPLTDTIIRLQRRQSSWIIAKKIQRSADFRSMLKILVEKYLLPAARPRSMIELTMLEKPSARDCHDVRAYSDEAGCLHWFDANAGWFKSDTPNPSAETLIKFLVGLFEFLNYDYFKCCAKQKAYTLSSGRTAAPPPPAPRLTFKFDTESNKETQSSDDEDEIEQLKRWVAMRKRY